MIIKTLAVGPIMANCFIVGCEQTREAAVIDPGDEADRILRTLAEAKLTVTQILNTHGRPPPRRWQQAYEDSHRRADPDPRAGRADAACSRSAAAWGRWAEDSPAPDRTIDEGDSITVGTITFKVIHTPGHTPGGVALLADGRLFVGDTLFAGSVGRTDFPGGDFDTLKSSIQKKLFALADDRAGIHRARSGDDHRGGETPQPVRGDGGAAVISARMAPGALTGLFQSDPLRRPPVDKA